LCLSFRSDPIKNNAVHLDRSAEVALAVEDKYPRRIMAPRSVDLFFCLACCFVVSLEMVPSPFFEPAYIFKTTREGCGEHESRVGVMAAPYCPEQDRGGSKCRLV
jgi:hypothetical protein